MIIDSHVHFGKALNWSFDKKEVIEAMNKYGIDYAIVSNLAACEFGHGLVKIDDALQKSQIALNMETVDFVKEYPDRVKGLFWIKPHLEGYCQEIENFIEANRQYICGIKVHPYHSKMEFTSDNYKGYLMMCSRMRLPVAVHTDSSKLADPENVYRIAKEYPDINFVMVHMGLGTDHLKSMKYMKELPNLYGDTTWVTIEAVMQAIKECGSGKILFGTDSVIDGIDTYVKYMDMMSYLRRNLSEEECNNIFYKNAQRIFKLS